jgi:hypothetical protein
VYEKVFVDEVIGHAFFSGEEIVVGIPLAGILIRAPARSAPTIFVTDSSQVQRLSFLAGEQ